jgi:hypothetical protein
MKPKNLRRPQTLSLSEQHRAIVVEAICTLIDSLLDLLIAVDPAPPYSTPFIGWELPAARRRTRRQARPQARLIDDNTALPRCVSIQPPSPVSSVETGETGEHSEHREPGVHYSWAYPLQAVWDKHIRTSRN